MYNIHDYIIVGQINNTTLKVGKSYSNITINQNGNPICEVMRIFIHLIVLYLL